MTQIAGAKKIPILLAQGTYGCVYNPGVQCGTGATLGKKFVTKIHRKAKYAEKEIHNSNKIKKLFKQHAKYFAISLDNCDVNVRQVSGNEMQKCDFIRESKETDPNVNEYNGLYVSTKMKFISGSTLADFLDELTTKIDSQIFSICKRLYTCVQKLHLIRIVHYDLKENNMILKDNTGLPVLIDFGLSIDMDKFLDKDGKLLSDIPFNTYNSGFYVYATDYVPWHIDIDIICYIIQEIGEKEWTGSVDYRIIEKIFDEWNYAYTSRRSKLSSNQQKCWDRIRTIIPKDIVDDCFPTKQKYLDMIRSMNIGNWKGLVEQLILRWKFWDMYAICVL